MAQQQAADFNEWHDVLAGLVAALRKRGLPEPTMQLVERMLGNIQPADWHFSASEWRYRGDFNAWEKLARELLKSIDETTLAQVVSLTFFAHAQLTDLLDMRSNSLIYDADFTGSPHSPKLLRQALVYLTFCYNGLLVAATRRKAVLRDTEALGILNTMKRALLRWAAAYAAEPDIPFKAILAWLADHRFSAQTQAQALLQTISATLSLIPASGAAERRYIAHMQGSVEKLLQTLVESPISVSNALQPLGTPYPAASFHKDWDALIRAPMTALNFTRIKGSTSRWIRPQGTQWLVVLFHPGSCGWSKWGGGSFSASFYLCGEPQFKDTTPKQSLHFFSSYTDAEFAAFLQLNEVARCKIKRLEFPAGFEKTMHESTVLDFERHANQRYPGAVQPDFHFYDPQELADWAAALLPTLDAKLQQAVAAGPI
ncbi:hypothetical protein SAMN02745857_01054 [Andreprevotia lacus DSM 23236]|jgi:hypothetical protein|uniref:Uncharacterized protein n=1 Tax=Andreprevotia lacus DSM 23236 TaxID=1121001 RepID=A0A1W1XA40_9NEIS|nr:hypothetical protein [Andreprevotia lacus]SMC20806.1 hypothetical protein SAMN02745857_01054 [Andreprevotia lacus DSM 23236]